MLKGTNEAHIPGNVQGLLLKKIKDFKRKSQKGLFIFNRGSRRT
jgi:hypothetical protein